MESPAVVIIVLTVLIVTPILNLFCYQKFINYTGRTRLIFTNIYVIITVIDVSFVSCYAFLHSPKIPELPPLFILRQVFSLTSLKDSHRSAHRLQQGAWMEDSAFPCFLNPPTNSTPPKFPTFLQTESCICPDCDVKYYQ